MKAKKALTILTALALCAALTACGETASEEPTPSAEPSPSPSEPAGSPEFHAPDPPAWEVETPFAVTLDFSVGGEEKKPVFYIMTNLPDGFQFNATLTNGRSDELKYIAQDYAVVRDGIAECGPFTIDGGSLYSLQYTLKVGSGLPKLQTSSVVDIIGASGENITGQFVEEREDGTRMIYAEYKIDLRNK